MRADAGMLLYGMSYALSPIDIKYKEAYSAGAYAIDESHVSGARRLIPIKEYAY